MTKPRWLWMTLSAVMAFANAPAPAIAQALSFTDILQRVDRPAPDHKIAYGPAVSQYGELWLPPATHSPGGDLPVVVLIHGGCWLSDYPGPELVAFLADGLRRQGAAVWSITYRRVAIGENVQGGGYPSTFLDVAHAVDHLRALAGPYHLDLARVVAAGHSAGGHLALWAAARPKLPADSLLKTAHPLPIKSVVSIAGLADLAYAATASAHACGEGTVEKLVDSAARGKPAFRDTSPSELLPLGVPQVLISGVFDGIVPPVHGWRYQSRAKARGESVELLNLDNAGHFELISPWTVPGRAVVNRILQAL